MLTPAYKYIFMHEYICISLYSICVYSSGKTGTKLNSDHLCRLGL